MKQYLRYGVWVKRGAMPQSRVGLRSSRIKPTARPGVIETGVLLSGEAPFLFSVTGMEIAPPQGVPQPDTLPMIAAETGRIPRF